MKNKKMLCMMMVMAMSSAVVFTGCGKDQSGSEEETYKLGTVNTGNTNTDKTDDSNTNQTTGGKVDKIPGVFTNFDQEDTWGTSAKTIELSSGDVTIDKEGTYVLSGTLSDGQIYVNVSDEEKVQLVLNGVDITCKDSAAIFVENADKVSITLAPGTENVVSDGGNESTTDADGCIYAKDDLSINGSGKLIVNGNVSNGIDCNNDIKIVSGELVINAVNNGIKAKQSISIKDGDITVKAEDCIKASAKSDDTIGTFYMEGGKLDLEAKDDAITATISITIADGEVLVNAVGKKTNCDGTENISEGCIKEK